jgi:hypothetical protein
LVFSFSAAKLQKNQEILRKIRQFFSHFTFLAAVPEASGSMAAAF